MLPIIAAAQPMDSKQFVMLTMKSAMLNPKLMKLRALCVCLLIVIFSPFLLALCELNPQKK